MEKTTQYTYKVVTRLTNDKTDINIYQSDMSPRMMFLTLDSISTRFVPFENHSVNINKDSILSVTHLVR
jgi:hypothetical protein